MQPVRINKDDPSAVITLSRHIARLITDHGEINASLEAKGLSHADDRASRKGFSSGVHFVCIGTDRSTGDALGPLVGSQLQQASIPGVTVDGTLQYPVHAGNIHSYAARLRDDHPGKLVIAIDACLGKAENVGTVCVKPGPLKPGTAVHKQLPAIGHVHIVGIVNVGGYMEYFVLQNTRLNLVIELANLISKSLVDALRLHLYDHFDFNGHTKRQRVSGNSRSGVVTLLPKYVSQQLGSAVHNEWLSNKIGSTIDPTEHFYNANNAVEMSDFFL